MDKNEIVENLVNQWKKTAERDLLAARQILGGEIVVTEAVCFHCQQAVEKLLKAFLVKHQIEFAKTHSIMVLINKCSEIDKSFKDELSEADLLTDYAVEVRYPDDWYEPTVEEARNAYQIALKGEKFILEKLCKSKK
jgi:HEPN domain-containing protein